jgi:O-antigen/teichoic acid export membrane protein
MVLKLSLLTALVYGVVLWFYNTPLCQEHPFLVLFGGLSIVSGSVLNVSTGLLMGIHQPQIAQIGEKLIRPMLIFSCIVLASFQLGLKLTDTSMMVFQFAGFVVASLYAIRRLFNELPLPLNTSAQRASLELNLRSSGRLMFGTLFYLVYLRIDIILLGWYYPTAYENIAYYNIALRFSELLLIPSSFLLSMFSAELCKLFFEGSKQPLQRLSNKIKILQIAMVLAMALPILLFHRPILELFGKAFYLEGSLVLGLLCLVPILNALLGVFGSVLYLTHGEKYQYIAQGIGLVVNVLGLYFLLPPMGIVGAAISVVCSTIVYLTALYLIGRRHFEQLK